MYYRCSLVRCRPMLHVTFYVFTLRPSSAVAMVYHFQSSMVVRSFRLLFSFVSSFNTYSLPSINYSASVPHNKIRNQSLFPLLCIVRAVSSKVHLFIHSNLVVFINHYYLSSGNILAALVSSWSVWVLCGGCFYIPTFCSRHMPMIAPILHPRLIHSSIDIYFTISSSLLAFNIIIIDLQIVSSIVGV